MSRSFAPLTVALSFVALAVACGSSSSTTTASSTTAVTSSSTSGPSVTSGSSTVSSSSSTSGGGSTGAGGSGTGGSVSDAGSDGAADLCTQTGGTVTTTQCNCASQGDFPSTCEEGSCTCAPGSSHTISTCTCPGSECYDPTNGCMQQV